MRSALPRLTVVAAPVALRAIAREAAVKAAGKARARNSR